MLYTQILHFVMLSAGGGAYFAAGFFSLIPLKYIFSKEIISGVVFRHFFNDLVFFVILVIKWRYLYLFFRVIRGNW